MSDCDVDLSDSIKYFLKYHVNILDWKYLYFKYNYICKHYQLQPLSTVTKSKVDLFGILQMHKIVTLWYKNMNKIDSIARNHRRATRYTPRYRSTRNIIYATVCTRSAGHCYVPSQWDISGTLVPSIYKRDIHLYCLIPVMSLLEPTFIIY